MLAQVQEWFKPCKQGYLSSFCYSFIEQSTYKLQRRARWFIEVLRGEAYRYNTLEGNEERACCARILNLRVCDSSRGAEKLHNQKRLPGIKKKSIHGVYNYPLYRLIFIQTQIQAQIIFYISN